MESTSLDQELRMFDAVHESGHALIAISLGLMISKCELNVAPGVVNSLPDGGACCWVHPAKQSRSWDASVGLGGFFACALYCRGNPWFESQNNWQHLKEDLRMFNELRGGWTFRQGRRLVLDILSSNMLELLQMSAVLYKDGKLDHSNAPSSVVDWFTPPEFSLTETLGIEGQ